MLATSSHDLSVLGVLRVSASIAEHYAKEYNAKSIVGHADTAAVLSSILGMEVKFNRETVSLVKGDTLIVGQYKGPRMEEGCKALPPGATIEWLFVTIH